MEARVRLVALLQRLLRVLEEVDEGRVRAHQVLCVSAKKQEGEFQFTKDILIHHGVCT